MPLSSLLDRLEGLGDAYCSLLIRCLGVHIQGRTGGAGAAGSGSGGGTASLGGALGVSNQIDRPDDSLVEDLPQL